jgi:hypothetical protein
MIGQGARRSEHCDAVSHAREFFEALHELAHDAQHPPGVGVEELIGLRCLEQALVLSAVLMVFVIVLRASSDLYADYASCEIN